MVLNLGTAEFSSSIDLSGAYEDLKTLRKAMDGDKGKVKFRAEIDPQSIKTIKSNVEGAIKSAANAPIRLSGKSSVAADLKSQLKAGFDSAPAEAKKSFSLVTGIGTSAFKTIGTSGAASFNVVRVALRTIFRDIPGLATRVFGAAGSAAGRTFIGALNLAKIVTTPFTYAGRVAADAFNTGFKTVKAPFEFTLRSVFGSDFTKSFFTGLGFRMGTSFFESFDRVLREGVIDTFKFINKAGVDTAKAVAGEINGRSRYRPSAYRSARTVGAAVTKHRQTRRAGAKK
jgi:hypothetical protein